MKIRKLISAVVLAALAYLIYLAWKSATVKATAVVATKAAARVLGGGGGGGRNNPRGGGPLIMSEE